VKAVVLEVNSPGGGVTASDIIAHEVGELARKKKVVVCMKGVAASGGYYVSAGAHKIYAHPTTITGSIGVLWASANFEELMNNIGVRFKVIKTGPLKDAGSGYREMTPEDEEMIRTVIDDAFERFKKVVRDGRELTVEQVDSIATGAVFTAAEAKRLGLVDEIGYMEDAIKGVKVLAHLDDATVVRYRTRPSLIEALMAHGGTGEDELRVRVTAPGTDWLPAGMYYVWESGLPGQR